MSEDIFVDYKVKPYEFEKESKDIKNNIVVPRDSSKNSGTLYAFTQGLFKPNQKLFIMVSPLKQEKNLTNYLCSMTGKHFLREVRDVSIFKDYYVVTWRPEE
jgi:hypothetical protein